MLLLIGDSYAIAMREALAASDDDLKAELRATFGHVAAGMIDPDGKLQKPFHRMKAGAVAFSNAAMARRVDAIAERSITIDKNFDGIVGVSGGFHFQFLIKRPLWRKYSVTFKAGKHFLTRAVLGELAQLQAIGIRSLVQDLVSLGIKCFLMESPPPKHGYVSARKAMDLDEILALEGMLREFRRQFARQVGIPIISNPDHVMEDGILKETYAARDQHHGNVLYGVEMWREILRNAPRLTAGRQALRAAG